MRLKVHEKVDLQSDPVIDAYKRDIDQTLLRENLKLTVEERFLKLMELQRFATELRRAGQHASREGGMGKEKSEALDLIRKLPDDVTTGAIMEELFFKQQVDKGLQDVAEGRVLTHQELKERITRWRKSAGR